MNILCQHAACLDLQSSTKVLAHLATFAIPVRAIFITLPPSPQFNVVYRDKVIIARLQHCLGGEGPSSNDAGHEV